MHMKFENIQRIGISNIPICEIGWKISTADCSESWIHAKSLNKRFLCKFVRFNYSIWLVYDTMGDTILETGCVLVLITDHRHDTLNNENM